MDYNYTPALTSLVAIGFISATSLLLANALGSAVYSRENGNFRHRSDSAARLRKQIASFPHRMLALYCLFSSLVVATLFTPWNPATVSFAFLYIAWMVCAMAYLCARMFRVFSGDDRLEP